MILDALFSLFEAAVNGLLGLLPESTPPDLSGMVDGLAAAFGFAGWLNKYVPLDQAGLMLGVLSAVFLVTYGVKFGVWFLTKLHVLGGE